MTRRGGWGGRGRSGRGGGRKYCVAHGSAQGRAPTSSRKTTGSRGGTRPPPANRRGSLSEPQHSWQMSGRRQPVGHAVGAAASTCKSRRAGDGRPPCVRAWRRGRVDGVWWMVWWMDEVRRRGGHLDDAGHAIYSASAAGAAWQAARTGVPHSHSRACVWGDTVPCAAVGAARGRCARRVHRLLPACSARRSCRRGTSLVGCGRRGARRVGIPLQPKFREGTLV